LPTGLGKTLIASVVMYNYYKWFPSGKVVFMAPTKPLVNQQLTACHDIMGIPEGHTANMQGTTNPEKRASFWNQKRVFFCTPQTFTNDLKSEIIDAKRVTLIVIDEAHKATGDYAYTTAVKSLEENGGRFRVLALSATPGTDPKKVQHVLLNLRIARLEIRFEDDPEIQQYSNDILREIIWCPKPHVSTSDALKDDINDLIKVPLKHLNEINIIPCAVPANIQLLVVDEAKETVQSRFQSGVMNAGEKQRYLECLREMEILLNCRR